MTDPLTMLGLILFGAGVAMGCLWVGWIGGRRSLEAAVRAMRGQDPLRRERPADISDETE